MWNIPSLLSSGWTTFLGLTGVVVLVIAFAIFWMGWPVVSPLLQRILTSVGDWLEYNLSLELSGWKVISNSAAALIFLMTAMLGVHIVDRTYFLKQSKEQICAAMLQDLRENYKFVEKPKPKAKGWFK